MDEDNNKEYRWETGYEKTWEAIQEDKDGLLDYSVQDIILKARRKKKVVIIMLNFTTCSRRVFKLDKHATHSRKFARGLPEIFNLETLAELTAEDKTLSKMIKASICEKFSI